MKIRQIITDYIRRSLLTTQGDMIVRGAALPARLVAVAVGQVLKSAGVGALPAWGVPSMQYVPMKTGFLQRSSSGDEVVTGVGFKPYLILFFVCDNDLNQINLSWGFDLIATQNAIYTYEDGTKTARRSAQSIYIYRDASNNIGGQVSATDTDGFTITWALVGTCAADVIYLAIG